jgi:hypothetical protein
MAENLVARIGDMQQQGMSDEDIVATLAQEGVNPADINDAIGKSNIKSAVYQEPAPGEQLPAEGYPQDQMPQQPMPPAGGGMPMPPAGGGYGGQFVQGMSSETVTEIAEQIISEKLTAVTKSITTIDVFRDNVQRIVNSLDERLKQVESVIDELKSAIIKKFGEVGENVEAIKNEMGMVQDSFSKVVKPWTEQAAKGNRQTAPARAPAPEPEPEEAEAEPEEEQGSGEDLIKRLKPKRKR